MSGIIPDSPVVGLTPSKTWMAGTSPAMTMAGLRDVERIDRLRLIRSDNVGPRGIMAQMPPTG
jgi:hypothetical protein